MLISEVMLLHFVSFSVESSHFISKTTKKNTQGGSSMVPMGMYGQHIRVGFATFVHLFEYRFCNFSYTFGCYLEIWVPDAFG